MKKKNALLFGIGAALVTAAGIFMIWKKKQTDNKKDQPPKDAPQLNIEHPGSQSEFPTAPSDSDLG